MNEDDVTTEAPPEEVERTRRQAIRTFVRSAGLPAELADDLIDSDANETTLRTAVNDARQARRSQPIIRTHAPANDDPAVTRSRQEAALVYRMGGSGELPASLRRDAADGAGARLGRARGRLDAGDVE